MLFVRGKNPCTAGKLFFHNCLRQFAADLALDGQLSGSTKTKCASMLPHRSRSYPMSGTNNLACGRPVSRSRDVQRRTDGPDRHIIHLAAKVLGHLPKTLFGGRRNGLRRWTGFVGSERMWVGRKVVLADGSVGRIKQIQRGVAVVRVRLDGNEWPVALRLPATALRIWKSPSAVLLGGLKRGTKEKPSAKKLAACRQNGKRPAKPGSRKRGRPRRDAPDWQRFVLKSRNRMPRSMSLNALQRWAAEQQRELADCLRAEAAAGRRKDEPHCACGD